MTAQPERPGYKMTRADAAHFEPDAGRYASILG